MSSAAVGTRLRFWASVVLTLAVLGFFWHAFRANWETIRAHRFEFRPAFAALALLAFLATTFLGTWAWHASFNAVSRHQLTIRESVAVVNASAFVKYIPGKVWSYAFQMYWLSKRGITKSLVVYVNLINTAVTLLTAALLGMVLLLLSPEQVAWELVLALLAVLAVLDFVCIRFNAALFGLLLKVVNRVFRKSIERLDIPLNVMLLLHLLHMAANVTFAAAIWAVCFAIGYEPDLLQASRVMAAFLLAEVVAFVTLISPGGVGVRESVMYALLGGAASGSFALLVPLAARAVSMLGDLIVGSVALRLLKEVTPERSRDPLQET